VNRNLHLLSTEELWLLWDNWMEVGGQINSDPTVVNLVNSRCKEISEILKERGEHGKRASLPNSKQ
jgi:hypothetical protein